MEEAARQTPTLPPATHVPDLRAAIRRARLEDAERSAVVTELRGSELARLEGLMAAVQPILAQVPQGVDVFDVGMSHGERPRLFVDMVAFVEMGRDRRTFRFIKDTREGRVVVAENDQIDPMVEAIAGYVARRLVEREKALASERSGVLPVAAKPAPAAPAVAAVPVVEEAGIGGYLFAFIAGIATCGVVVYLLLKLKLLVM